MPGKKAGWVTKRVQVSCPWLHVAPAAPGWELKEGQSRKPCPCLSALPEYLRTGKRAQGQTRGPGSVTLHKPPQSTCLLDLGPALTEALGVQDPSRG